MRTVSDKELYVDGGLLSGLEAMSELRELLDELYASLQPNNIPNKNITRWEGEGVAPSPLLHLN